MPYIKHYMYHSILVPALAFRSFPSTPTTRTMFNNMDNLTISLHVYKISMEKENKCNAYTCLTRE